MLHAASEKGNEREESVGRKEKRDEKMLIGETNSQEKITRAQTVEYVSLT